MVLRVTLFVLFFGGAIVGHAKEKTPPVSESPKFGFLSLRHLAPNVPFKIDGEAYGKTGKMGPVLLSVGEHTLNVGPNDMPIKITIKEGEIFELEGAAPVSEAPKLAATKGTVLDYYGSPTKEKVAFGLIGLGALSLATGTVFGINAVNLAEDTRGLTRDTISRNEYEAIVESAHSQVANANLMLTSGGLMIVSGLASLYLNGFFEDEERR